MKIPLQFPPVVPQRLSVHARRFPVARELSTMRSVSRLLMWCRSAGPQTSYLLCLTHQLQLMGALSGSVSGDAFAVAGSFIWPALLPPSPPPPGCPDLVRERLHRYYRAVRLPKSVRHRQCRLRLTDAAPEGKCATGEEFVGISRVPVRMPPVSLCK